MPPTSESPIEFVGSVDSTNSYILDQLSGLSPFHAVATMNQTLGRGRLGRSWESPPDLGLAVSVALPVLPRVESVGLYSLIVGSAVLRFVRNEGVSEVLMKWPNDILVRGKKVAGILCEMGSERIVVGGIGLNVFHGANELPNEHSTSLLNEGVRVEDSHGFVERLIAEMKRVWREMEYSRDSWSRLLSPSVGTIGKKVSVVETDHSRWFGTAESLDEDGHLLVRSIDDGELRTVVAADVLHLRQ